MIHLLAVATWPEAVETVAVCACVAIVWWAMAEYS